ncbi:hypothetical protein [Rheinheimera sp.]|uniref:hypothetical protein n=1 Tax=Rheinheimera sp. TaxID=1869214 RepID=UPI002732980A|nr:hypothetical protein [Rheinheimera sp.]MDP2716313.1 hypothetical protein [Rheinheimera sp.]
MKHLTTMLMFCALLALNGCTVLGIIVDNKVDNRTIDPIVPPGTHVPSKVEPSFASEGLEADIAIAKLIKDAIFPAKPQPKVRCAMENGLRICYEEGAEGY